MVILNARRASPAAELELLLRRQARLSAANLTLGLIVLGLTAIARSA